MLVAIDSQDNSLASIDSSGIDGGVDGGTAQDAWRHCVLLRSGTGQDRGFWYYWLYLI
jgi:hypothetical protein